LPTRRRTLLIADDSPTVQKVVSLTFADEGFHVIAVGTGAQALAEIEREVPDVLLADVHMPAPGGYELCARVKRDGRTRHVPVVLLVGSFEPFDEAEARTSGADEVLTKPFQSIRDLVNKVGSLLGGQSEAAHADERRDDASISDARRDNAPATRATEATTGPDTNAMNQSTNDPMHAADAGSHAHAYTDLDMDDANIETVPADAFDTRQPAPPADIFAEDAVESFAVSAATNGAHAQTRSFEARADAAAAADDTLLELGDIDSNPARANEPDDDFVLDFSDDSTSDASRGASIFGDPTHAASSQGASAYQESTHVESSYVEPGVSEPTFSEDAPSAVEMQSAGSVSIAEPSVMWDAAQEFTVAPDAITEPVQAPAWEEPEVRAINFDEGDAQSRVNDEDAHTSREADAQDDAPPAYATSVARATDPQPASESGTAQLSPETIDAIAHRVVELISDSVVREIAWEVVPDLAERIIRQRLEEERTR
jgi:CheY-like chemotaxis protein